MAFSTIPPTLCTTSASSIWVLAGAKTASVEGLLHGTKQFIAVQKAYLEADTTAPVTMLPLLRCVNVRAQNRVPQYKQ